MQNYLTIDGAKSAAASGLLRMLLSWFYCNRAAIAPMTAILMVPVVGSIAYAIELGSWQYLQRSAQNAADSAALAAATVNSGTATTGSLSSNEARAAARQFGFVDGVNSASVTSALTSCPPGVAAGSICYEAIVGTTFPLSFSRVIGFGAPGQTSQSIVARAVAIAAGSSGGGGAPTNAVCVWTFNLLDTNGTPQANLDGCAALSNGNMVCAGNGLLADYAVAGGTVTGPCANPQGGINLSGQTGLPADPYAGMVSSIPPNTCRNYPRLGEEDVVQIDGEMSGEIKLCGDIQLKGDVTLTGNATKLVIYNGRLDLNRHTVKTAAGATATVIFSGTTDSTYHHYPVDFGTGSGSGVMEIEAPTGSADPFKGVAVYQDPRLGNTNVGFTYTGNKPAWKITGAIYLPNANVTFSGIVDKADDGSYCQILVADTVRIDGTGKIIGDVTGCAAAGITPPTVPVGPALAVREKLVL
ncbi:pilus assembly protein TadG-related protein [Parafrankia sp. BMG5.11]|uniref:pilus assembly protein TadG-related protein n=1 Tax=Parafrankia sp. BMG5.11 TaxID=222540 RepID=UPI0014055BE7|nr:pilus assembly protein TadG-related protein [Parafrankia sp. BMG5.11]